MTPANRAKRIAPPAPSQQRISLWLSWMCGLVLLSGCATTVDPWVRVQADERSYQPLVRSYTVDLPSGWVHLINPQAPGLVTATRDGFGLNDIEFNHIPHEYAFQSINKASREDMPLSELAELFIANIKAGAQLSNLVTVSNKPAKLSRRQAFRIHLEAKDSKGLNHAYVVYGFVSESGFFYASYAAPKLHYFAKSLPVFEKSAQSMRLQVQ